MDLPQPAPGAARELSRRRDDPCDPRQLHHPQEPGDAGLAGRVWRPAAAALPAAVLPNENRIERIWLTLHANVTRNHQQRTIGALLDRVHRYLAERFDTRRRVLLAA